MVFPGVQKSTWTHDKLANAWYFHRFYEFQPDLNTANPPIPVPACHPIQMTREVSGQMG
jgi:glycosidase